MLGTRRPSVKSQQTETQERATTITTTTTATTTKTTTTTKDRERLETTKSDEEGSPVSNRSHQEAPGASNRATM